MDAQNAAETDQTRPSAASAQRRRGSQVDSKNASSLDSKSAATAAAAAASTSADSKPKPSTASASAARADDGADDRDSDAETIVLPGKDGHSPSKVRKVRQEDKSESDGDASKSKAGSKASKADGDSTSVNARSGDLPRRKRLSSTTGPRPGDKDGQARGKDGASSGLSSVPNSPTQTHRRLQHRRQRSRSDAAPVSESESDDESTHKSSKPSLRDKPKSGDRLVSQKRKAPKVESDDEADGRKARRQRTTSAGVEPARGSRDGRVSSRSQRDARTQSRSPPPRHHRRSTSTQLQPSNGLSQKKKRLPPPLQSTEYHSDDSSASGSPHPRSTKLRSLVTPSNSESHMSPAKVGPHKKHLDAHGQTLLARACARGEYDGVKQRLEERPEDLNVADYAGNTPLQIAAINGCEDIVKLLLEAGCNLDCVNYDKDTPLLDAVDNGHLEVVKLLLDAGVNPRKANVNGEEPIDRVTEETDNGEEIRALLIAAKKKAGDRTRTSEDRNSQHELDNRDSHAPDSPRRSPAASLPSGRRSTTGRATKTRNDLLYMPLDDKTLRQAAGRGDEETVARILQVKEGFDDPESMVAAARGGHDLVIQLLLGLGGANADPGPISGLPAEFATPILAAIGQENIKVVDLLLEQNGFDPTRRFKGETYYEIARRRQGPNWKDEEHVLRNAYDEYKRSLKDGAPSKSPSRKEREREEKRAKREEARADAKRERKSLQSPSRDAEPKRKISSKLEGKRRSESFSTHGDEETPKRGPGRPRKEDKLAVVQSSDREASPNVTAKSKIRRAESDAAAASSDGESVKPRRKLISKGELRGERDKKHRVSSSGKEPTSPKASRGEEAPEKQKMAEKYRDRTKALKRDPSRDTDPSSKRQRNSTTPDRSADAEKDDAEIPMKRRRLDGDASEKKTKRSALDEKAKKSKTDGKAASDDDSVPDKKSKDSRRNSDRSNSSDKVKIKSEDVDVAMSEAPLKEPSAENVDEAEAARKKEAEEAAAAKEKKRLEEEETRRREEEDKKAKEEERKRREAEAARQREEEEKKRKEEEERKKREEEERLHREQLEREAAEAKRQQEEVERKERERRHREEMERKRAAREAEAKRLREEQERARLDKLPPLLRWLQVCPNPKLSSIAEKFRYMSGVRYDTIRPEATGTDEGREQWVLNTHVALLLGEKDFDLSRYTAWERAPVTRLAKLTLWRTEWGLYSLIAEKYWDLGQQLPDYYGEDPSAMSFETKQRLKSAAWERFAATDMFFVKLSDLLYTVSNISHLRNLTLAVEYRELLESEAQAVGWKAPQKWKQDPGADRFHGFAPRHKYYVGGNFVREDVPTKHSVSTTPFPEKRVPRRGLVQVFPDDPDYQKLCVEQGLEHLVKGEPSPSLPNGVHTSAMEAKLINGTNGHGHGHLEPQSVTVNGGSH